jgi:ELWxxDGT repeat protein
LSASLLPLGSCGKSDSGATETAFLLKDINVGGPPSSPDNFTSAGREVFFLAGGTSGRRALWKTDGTSEGTINVKEVVDANYLTPVGEALFFAASDPEHGDELWRSDGTAFGTALVKDINPGPARSGPAEPYTGSSFPKKLTAVQGTLFFTACDEDHGWELWKSDGTAAGTVIVKDIAPGPWPPVPPNVSVCLENQFHSPSNLTASGRLLYFFAEEPSTGRELWRSDGSPGGTFLVKDAFPGPDPPLIMRDTPVSPELTNANGTLLFWGRNGTLWRSDGTAEGTMPVAHVFGSLMTAVGRRAFFANADGLWTSDGTAEGTRLVKAVSLATSVRFQNRISDMEAVGDELYFVAGTSEAGYELWKSDGTAAGTMLVQDVRPGPESSNEESLTAIGGLLYFTADDGTLGRQLWRTDGSSSGTRRLTDLRPGVSGGLGQYPVRSFGLVRDLLLFSADDGVHGAELWAFRARQP